MSYDIKTVSNMLRIVLSEYGLSKYLAESIDGGTGFLTPDGYIHYHLSIKVGMNEKNMIDNVAAVVGDFTNEILTSKAVKRAIKQGIQKHQATVDEKVKQNYERIYDTFCGMMIQREPDKNPYTLLKSIGINRELVFSISPREAEELADKMADEGRPAT